MKNYANIQKEREDQANLTFIEGCLLITFFKLISFVYSRLFVFLALAIFIYPICYFLFLKGASFAIISIAFISHMTLFELLLFFSPERAQNFKEINDLYEEFITWLYKWLSNTMKNL